MKNRILQSQEPSIVRIADKPLSQGGTIKDMPLEEFEKMIGQAFLERIDLTYCDIHPSEIEESITGCLSKKSLTTQLDHLLIKPRDDLVLCKINEKVGYGVFASNDIPANTVLCFYAGTLVPSMKTESNSHAMQYFNSNAKFSTQYFRGIASFFQHFPSELIMPDAKAFSQYLQMSGQQVSEQTVRMHHELYSVKFLDSSAREQLATTNIRQEYICYRDMPVILMMTNRDIKKEEQLGFSYGERHWLYRGIVPEFFNSSGEILLRTSYIRTFYQLKFDGFTYTGELAPLIKQFKMKNDDRMIALIADNREPKKINALVVLEELFRVHAILPSEYQSFTKSLSQRPLEMGLFSTHMVAALIKKYQLLDDGQASLEKGLRKAAVNNEIEDLKKFIKIVNNINAQDSNPEVSRTALHWAAIKGHQTCCQLLIESGANDNIPDAKGEVAKDRLQALLVSSVKP